MRVTVCDVGPRDGLQNQPLTLAPSARAKLVNLLTASGVPRIEVTSFVSERHVPQMAGAAEVGVADTVGVGVPEQVRGLVGRLLPFGVPVGVHFHNTRNTGYANAFAALEAGATVFDASVAGIGGCPFAPRATGNIATEDLVYLLHGQGVETGIDLDGLIAASQWLETQLGRELEGQVYKAGTFAPVAS